MSPVARGVVLLTPAWPISAGERRRGHSALIALNQPTSRNEALV
jgi:hypothetical protein